MWLRGLEHMDGVGFVQYGPQPGEVQACTPDRWRLVLRAKGGTLDSPRLIAPAWDMTERNVTRHAAWVNCG